MNILLLSCRRRTLVRMGRRVRVKMRIKLVKRGKMKLYFRYSAVSCQSSGQCSNIINFRISFNRKVKVG